MRRVSLAFLLAATLASPAFAGPPLKVLILPADLKIYLLTAANSLDPQPLASQAASSEAAEDARTFVQSDPDMEVVNLPALDATDQSTLDQHLALYRVAASSALAAQKAGDAWKPALVAFDYTVGPGLQFLKQKTGADVALVLDGEDADSTGGRVAMNMLASLLGGVVSSGRNFMVAGFVDLETGRIRWLEYDTGHVTKNFTDPAVINQYVREMLLKYPQGSIRSDDSGGS